MDFDGSADAPQDEGRKDDDGRDDKRPEAVFGLEGTVVATCEADDQDVAEFTGEYGAGKC